MFYNVGRENSQWFLITEVSNYFTHPYFHLTPASAYFCSSAFRSQKVLSLSLYGTLLSGHVLFGKYEWSQGMPL